MRFVDPALSDGGDFGEHSDCDFGRRLAADRQPDRRMEPVDFSACQFQRLETKPPIRRRARGAHGPDVERVGLERFHEAHVIDPGVVGQRHDCRVRIVRVATHGVIGHVANLAHARNAELLKLVRARVAYDDIVVECQRDLRDIGRHHVGADDEQLVLRPVGLHEPPTGVVVVQRLVQRSTSRAAYSPEREVERARHTCSRVEPFDQVLEMAAPARVGFEVFDDDVEVATAGQAELLGLFRGFAVAEELSAVLCQFTARPACPRGRPRHSHRTTSP